MIQIRRQKPFGRRKYPGIVKGNVFLHGQNVFPREKKVFLHEENVSLVKKYLFLDVPKVFLAIER
jgi:hypothetical protein